MPVPGNPVAPLVVGQTFTVQAPITPSTGQQWVVELDNVSPYPLTIGGSIASSVLPPMQSNTYTAHSGPAGVTVTVNAPFDNSTPPEGVPAYLTNTWAIFPDHIQGVFPMAIPPVFETIGYQVSNLGGHTVPGAGGPIAVTLPLWAQSVVASIAGGQAIINYVAGATTGTMYNPVAAISSAAGFQSAISCSVAPALDSQIVFNVNSLAAPGGTLTVWASAGPPIPIAISSTLLPMQNNLNVAGTANLLMASIHTVYQIDSAWVYAQTTTGPATVSVQFTPLATNLLSSIIISGGPTGSTINSPVVTPHVLTYPGTVVNFVATGASIAGQFSGGITYRTLIP